MRNDYRGRMDVWFKTVLLFVVFNKVHLYRQLMNTTCLELAKPSNKHLRLSCNDSSIYHCLLNGNSTNEFEICENWKWIPGGNCAYLNEYGRNIDARLCLSSAELACPKTLYRSEETIKYAACYVKKNTNSKARQVRNTTCLELARPSNQQFRLSCNNIGTYHCLLDQNYTNEFEFCKMWKWIPKGKCAYYSMYSGDNIDERNCTSSSHFVCPEQKYRSENTTNYSACYIRNNPTTVQPLTSSSSVASNWTSSGGNGENASSSRISETAEKHTEIKSVIFFLYIIVIAVVLFISAIFYIPSYMGKGLCMEENFHDCVEDSLNTYDTGNANDEESKNSTVKKSNDAKPEEGNNSPQKEKTTDENNSVSDLSVTDKQNDDNDSQIFEMVQSSFHVSDNEEGSDEGTSYPCYGFVQSHYTQIAMEDKEDSFEVFADTFESLKKRENSKDEKDCLELYNLLFEKGLELSRNVIGSVIKKTIEKPNKKLSGDDTMENELEKGLPDGFFHLANERYKSFPAMYRLLQINLDEKHNPKSGWGNPVRDTDIGIGDDVERLNRIQNIGREIQKQAELSVESYFKLLDIMINALTRLDRDADFTEDLRTISNKRKNIEMVTKPENITCTDTTALL